MQSSILTVAKKHTYACQGVYLRTVGLRLLLAGLSAGGEASVIVKEV